MRIFKIFKRVVLYKPAQAGIISALRHHPPGNRGAYAGHGELFAGDLMRSLRVHPALVVIPLLVLLLSQLLVSMVGPYNLGGHVDPEYVELFNSLSLLTFRSPPSTVHPGTTIQELGAFVILAKWILGNVTGPWMPLESSAILHAEEYLHAMNLVLNVLVSLCMYFAASSIYRVSGSLSAALLLESSFFLFWQPVLSLTRVMPELLLIAIAFLLMITLAPLVWQPELDSAPGHRNRALVAGALWATGTVTKLSFLPMASIILLFPTWRRKLWFVAGSFGSAALLSVPIYGRFPEMGRYFFNSFTHAGYYGHGSPGLPSVTQLKANAIEVFFQEPSLAIAFTIYILAFLWTSSYARQNSVLRLKMVRLVLLSGCISIVVLVALVIHHYRAHYLLPVLMHTSFLNAILFLYCLDRQPRAPKVAILSLSLMLALVGALHTAKSAFTWAGWQRRERINYAALTTRLKSMSSCTQIGYDYSVLPSRALHFGNWLSEMQQGEILSLLYPDSLSYSWQDGKTYSFTYTDKTQHVTDLVTAGHCVLLVGSAISDFKQRYGSDFTLPPKLRVEPVMLLEGQGIYQLLAGAPPVDLALGKAAAQSSGFAEAGKAVDGNTDGNFFHGSVTHTYLESSPWWQVDLGASCSVDSIVIWNRTDCCSDRLNDYWVFVSDTPFQQADKPLILETRPGTWGKHETDEPRPRTYITTGGVRGRYVRVQLNGKDNLSLAEVQVFGAASRAGSRPGS